MLSIDDPRPVSGCALLQLGFRPFFAGAVAFAVVAMLLWMVITLFGWQPRPYGLSAQLWHAHEMLYGYALAVIAGFLLTAIRNWTGVDTIKGIPLLLLFLLWLVARVMPFFSDVIPLIFTAAIDTLFMLLLIAASLLPILKARQWHNLGILSKLVLLLAGNVLFYAGVSGMLANGVRWGLYSGLYLVLALIFVMGRRVIPFFIEKGVAYPVQVRNWKWLDVSSLLLFLLFWIADVFMQDMLYTSVLAGVLCVLHAARLIGWYTPGIWRRPLLWILYLAYAVIVVGFALKALVPLGVSAFLALHAFAVGGIGMMTIGMMARVSLGHTGRSIAELPGVLSWAFYALGLAALFRVLVPLLVQGHYIWWIAASQLLWVIGFSLLLFVFLPMWWRPRVDGRPG